MDERVPSIKITDNDANVTYELDFDGESVHFMAERGFVVNGSIGDLVAAKGPEFWYYAFRAHHKKLAKNQTDALLKKVGGLTPNIINRLVELYYQALDSSNILQDDEDLEKNPHVTVEIL